jgi:hypothetical protein
MSLDLYEQFKIGIALGADLDAPAGVNVYIAEGLDYDGIRNFLGIYNSKNAALHALANFALEELESLEYDAPWISMDYFEREKLTNSEYDKISKKKMSEWKSSNSLESVINAFWSPTENPDFNESWSVRKVKVN